MAASVDLDLAGVAKLATRFRKLSRGDERSAFERQYVNLRASEDGAVWHLSGRLTATDGQIVRKALDQRADRIPPLASPPDSELSPGQKQAIGLTTMAQDDLDQHLTPGDPTGREPVIMLIKDQALAQESGNTQGVEVFGGPRVGPQAVEEVECEGRAEPVTITDGQVVEIGPTRRQIPKRLRRAVLARDRKCVIDSCRSSYRLQTHHVVPRRDGGANTAANLATLCWYHHHIAIHRRGQRIDSDTPPHRRRLLPPRTWTGYRHPTNVEANLHGTTREQLEDRFRPNLKRRGYETLVDAVRSIQDEALDPDEFMTALDEHLQEGRFRLVFVLDEVPTELMTLVAYLEHVTDKLMIDLVAVNSFDVDGTSVVLPQRVTPEQHEVTVEQKRRGRSGTLHPGSQRFEESISQAPPESHESLHRLLHWARSLEKRGFVRLATNEGKGARRFTLLPRLVAENAGLVTIWNDRGAYIQFWRSIFDKKAPQLVDRIAELAGTRVGQENTTRNTSEELLAALTEAYEHAARQR